MIQNKNQPNTAIVPTQITRGQKLYTRNTRLKWAGIYAIIALSVVIANGVLAPYFISQLPQTQGFSEMIGQAVMIVAILGLANLATLCVILGLLRRPFWPLQALALTVVGMGTANTLMSHPLPLVQNMLVSTTLVLVLFAAIWGYFNDIAYKKVLRACIVTTITVVLGWSLLSIVDQINSAVYQTQESLMSDQEHWDRSKEWYAEEIRSVSFTLYAPPASKNSDMPNDFRIQIDQYNGRQNPVATVSPGRDDNPGWSMDHIGTVSDVLYQERGGLTITPGNAPCVKSQDFRGTLEPETSYTCALAYQDKNLSIYEETEHFPSKCADPPQNDPDTGECLMLEASSYVSYFALRSDSISYLRPLGENWPKEKAIEYIRSLVPIN